MKLFICTWDTNYGLQYCVVSAITKERAEILAKRAGAWDDMVVNEIGISPIEEVIFQSDK